MQPTYYILGILPEDIIDKKYGLSAKDSTFGCQENDPSRLAKAPPSNSQTVERKDHKCISNGDHYRETPAENGLFYKQMVFTKTAGTLIV